MLNRFFRLSIATFLSCLIVPGSPASEATSFYLKAGDTVVFYGDSITEQSLYTQFVELYAITRFPRMRVRFFGAGVGGDRVSGGLGGPIDERLTRDVFSHQPSVVTVMLGMNDGAYTATTEEIQGVYVKGYEHLLSSLRANSPGARITLLGPSPYDDITRPVTFPAGYNSVMLHFGNLDRELAGKFGATFVSLNQPVVAALERAQTLNPLAAQLIVPDRVHPDPIAHWIMAEALLAGWNAPDLVSSVTIAGDDVRVVEAQNASVEQLDRTNGTLRWTETENALPLPLNANNATLALLLQLTDIQQRLNQESLRVTGLAAGKYKLTIDGKGIGTFSAEELAKGINLADYETPMRSQAQWVAWGVRDRVEAHHVHMRMLIRKADAGKPETGSKGASGDVMDAYEESLNDANYQTAIPKAHIFSLSPAGPPP